MRPKAMFFALASASFTLCTLCGCSLQKYLSFAPSIPTLTSADALNRALHVGSLTQGEEPFHLVLEITPPRTDTRAEARPTAPADSHSDMHAEIELFWLNPSTYRTIIRSPEFNQIRIVNGSLIEEHDVGDFYPRWIQNFVDALLNPVPKLDLLRKTPGSIPIGNSSHACITASDSSSGLDLVTSQVRVCFQDEDPKLASGQDFARYVSFDDYTPFGKQQIARTMINVLPANLLVHGRITRLEHLPDYEYSLFKVHELTQPEKQIVTTLVPQSTAESLLIYPTSDGWLPPSSATPGATPEETAERIAEQSEDRMTLYVRTDRSGKVREAYRDRADVFGLQDDAVSRALTYRFKPLLVNGVPVQMEAPISLAGKPPRRP